jgi:hypothetical protein
MTVRIFHQPFDINGGLSRLGNELSGRLQSGDYSEVLIFSAYVTSSGTQRLSPYLRSVIETGGTVRALIGVRNGLTSLQAVTDLHAVGVEVWGLDTGGSILYHPKIYALRGEHAGWVSIGSSNLTGEGMYRNIETNTILELNLANAAERGTFDDVARWWNGFLAAYPHNARSITPRDVARLAANGVLVDEIVRARETRERNRRQRQAGRQRGNAPDVPRIFVPALPVVSGQRPVRRPVRQGQPVREEASLPRPTAQTLFFAMTLSAHDASKRTGTRGTPELSLPRPATDFFPPMAVSGRQYPDAYFDVRLNSGQEANIVEYRIWERPAGIAAGHADLRINIKHDTVDLTTPGGGDIILFEMTPEETGPAYDVWIISPVDANHAALLRRCSYAVAAQGAAAIKQYGFF